jgi:integrase
MRARHYSPRTEKAYVHWIKRYIFFHDKRHPAEMGATEVTAFLTALAVRDRVAASTQNQALSALLFLYREVLGVELPWLDDLVRAKRPAHLPVVLTREEVREVIGRLDGVSRLMAMLLYGAALRLLECCRLRIKDVDVAGLPGDANLRGCADGPAASPSPPRDRCCRDTWFQIDNVPQRKRVIQAA